MEDGCEDISIMLKRLPERGWFALMRRTVVWEAQFINHKGEISAFQSDTPAGAVKKAIQALEVG